MRKRCISLMLALALLLACFPAPAQAAGPPTRIDGFDYTKLKTNTLLQLPVTIKIGGREFKGWLQNGKTMSEADQDKIIKEIMSDWKITSGTFYRSKYLNEQVAKAQGFRPGVAVDLAIKGFMGGTGLDNVENAVRLMTLQVSDEEGGGMLINTALGAGLGKLASLAFGPYGPIAEAIVSGLWNCTDVAAQEVGRLIQESETAKEAVAYELKLKLFYEECNQKLLDAEKSHGGSSWHITCDGSHMVSKSLFGIPVIQHWQVNFNLPRTDFIYDDDSDPTNFGGVYRGTVRINIWHDLSGFDEAFYDRFYLGYVPLASVAGYFNMKDTYSSSSLYKELVCHNVEIHLDRDNMTSGTGMTEYFSLGTFQDTSGFNLRHRIHGGIKAPYYNSDGILHVSVGPASVHAECAQETTFTGSLGGGNRYPQLNMQSCQMRSNGYVSAPYGAGTSWNHNSGGPGGVIATDYSIFEDLGDGMVEVTVGG